MMSILRNLKTKLFLASLFVVLSATSLKAQDGFPDDVNDEPAVPIDGFVVAGLIAGAALGIKKIRKSKEA
ncbi:hypothetical protein D3C80_1065160 [compost metagenome]